MRRATASFGSSSSTSKRAIRRREMVAAFVLNASSISRSVLSVLLSSVEDGRADDEGRRVGEGRKSSDEGGRLSSVFVQGRLLEERGAPGKDEAGKDWIVRLNRVDGLKNESV